MAITIDNQQVEIINDVDKSISVMKDAGRWLEESGKNPTKWWKPDNMTLDLFSPYSKLNEFYVVLVNKISTAAAILHIEECCQDWKSIDKNKSVSALYIHWLCVKRQYAGKGLPKIIISFAEQKAKENGVGFLRVDTNAQETKLRKIYGDLGFKLISIVHDDYRDTAFYHKIVNK